MLLDELKKLQEDGLVIGKRHPTKPWTLFKYHNKVFYDNLWHVSPALLEARGVVIADNGEIIQRPFHKIFNVGENGTEKPEEAIEIRKVNGFMAAASWVDSALLVTTTGSFSSGYVELAKSYLKNLNWFPNFEDCTFLFEVCDPHDPHIVEEDKGAYLLAIREKESGKYLNQRTVTGEAADELGCFYPADRAPTDFGEGVVYYSRGGEPLAKTKTPHYLSKKALMRMGKKQARVMFQSPQEFRKRLDEEFFPIFQHLLDTYTMDEYIGFSEQQRRKLIEEYFGYA